MKLGFGILVVIILLVQGVWCESDVFYCQAYEGRFRICRKCPTLEESCEEPEPNEKCHCDNIELFRVKYDLIYYIF